MRALAEGDAAALRLDIPFIPHVTVAAFDHHDEAEDLVRSLGRVGVAGWLNRLDLLAFGGTLSAEALASVSARDALRSMLMTSRLTPPGLSLRQWA
mgnify:CR=1 FL=1